MSDTSNCVQTKICGSAGWITLNRPDALNAVDDVMTTAIFNALKTWATNDKIKAVVIDSALPNAFCAGGDVKKVYQSAQTNGLEHIETITPFFALEYKLNHYMDSYPKPIIPLMNGITLGGGLGLAMHSQYRIVSDGALLGMPETALGFFPDVGAAYFLQQCPGNMGYFLGLSGWRLTPAQALWAQLATHYVPQQSWDALKKALQGTFTNADDIINSYSTSLPEDTDLIPHMPLIERIMASGEIGIVIDAFNMSGEPVARDIANRMETYSPTSLKVWQYHWEQSQGMPLSMIIKNDYRVAYHFLLGHDFYEGIRAILIDKDKRPAWKPNVLGAVDKNMVEAFYAEPQGGDMQLS